MGAGITTGMPYLDPNNAQRSIQNLYDNVLQLRKELDWLLKGNLDEDYVVRAGSVVTDWVYAGAIEADQIDVSKGKITTAQIENLVVGDNVTMGPNAVITWGQVDGRPNTTYIDANGIYTGQITANQITGGSFTALNEINIGSMTDTTHTKYLRFVNGAYIYNYSYFGAMTGLGISAAEIDMSNTPTLLLPYTLEAGSGVSLQGNWDYSEADVIGLWDMMDDNPFISYTPNSFVKNMGGEHLRMQVIVGSDVNYIEIWDGSTYMGKVDLV